MHNPDRPVLFHSLLDSRTRASSRLISFISETTPEADWVIEYIDPKNSGEPLIEDTEKIMRYMSGDEVPKGH